MRKNSEVKSRRARKYMVAPVTRAVRAALAVSAATLAFGGQALAADAADTGHAPARHVAAQRDFAGPPVIDLTLVGSGIPNSVSDNATAGFAPTITPVGSPIGAAGGFDRLERVDDPSNPLADIFYSVDAPIIDAQVGPAFGVFADAGSDDVGIVNNSTIDIFSLNSVAAGMVGVGENVSFTNNGTIVTDGMNISAGIYAIAYGGTAHVDNTASGFVYSYGYGANTSAIALTSMGLLGGISEVSNSGWAIAYSDLATGIWSTGDAGASAYNNGFVLAIGGQSATGINATSFNDSAVVDVTNVGVIGAYANGNATGINASASGYDSAVFVDNSGAIYVGQYAAGNAAGISVFSGGTADVTNSGFIDVYAVGAASGISVNALGDISVTNSGDVFVDSVSAGVIAQGIIATSTSGTTSIDNDGLVDVTSMVSPGNPGAGSVGLFAVGANGASITNSGSVYGNGAIAMGMLAVSTYGNANLYNFGLVDVGDMDTLVAYGMGGVTNNGSIGINNSGDVIVQGLNLAIGLYGSSATGDVAIHNLGSVDVISDGFAGGIVGIGSTVIINNYGVVNAQSILDSTYGMYGNGANVMLNNGGVINSFNNGGDAYGMLAIATSSGQAFNTATGSILAVTDFAGGVAIGIGVDSLGAGFAINEGVVTANSLTSGPAVGITVSGDTFSGIVNTGEVNASSVDNIGLGLGANSLSLATVFNNGNVNVYGYVGIGISAFGGDTADAFNGGAIDVLGKYTYGASVTAGQAAVGANSGTVYSGDLLNTVYATGLSVTSSGDGGSAMADNGGIVSASALFGATGVSASAGGLDSHAQVDNSGSIYASQWFDFGEGAVGAIAQGNGTATVYNSGLIDVWSGGDADGIIALSLGDSTAINSGTVYVLSDYSNAVYAATGITSQSLQGHAAIFNSGNVYAISNYNTVGYLASGLVAYGYNGALVENQGFVGVSGDTAFGISASSVEGGTLVFNDGTVAVFGTDAYGVNAFSINGDTTFIQTAGGSLSVGDFTSDFARGVLAYSQNGNVSVDVDGGIYVNSVFDAYGVVALAPGGDISIANSGVIDAYGVLGNSIGVVAVGDQIDITNSGFISGDGTFVGMGIYANGNAVTINNTGTVVGYSYAANGFGMQVFGDTIDISGNGDIDVIARYDSYGVFASAGTSVDVNVGGYTSVFAVYGTATGVWAYSIGDATAVTNSGTLDVYSRYGYVNGIFAGSFGDVNVDNSGQISVDGYNSATGIAVQAGGSATIVNSGDINANVRFDTVNEVLGYHYSVGIFGYANDLTVVNSGSISASGDMSFGIYAIGNTAVNVVNSGDIFAGDLFASYAGTGIAAITFGAGSSASVDNSGLISVAGLYDAAGIVVQAAGAGSNAFVNNSGEIYASAWMKYDGAVGISAIAQGSSTVYNSGLIDVLGAGQADGIFAGAVDGNVTVVNSGAIVAVSDYSIGDYSANGINVIAQTGDAYVLNSGTIDASSTKYGNGYIANGILAAAGGDATVVNTGDITSTAWFSYGIDVTAIDGNATIVNAAGGSVVSGDPALALYAYGLSAQSVNGDAVVDNAGSVVASSYYISMGVDARSMNGDVTVDNSGVIDATADLWAVGIRARADAGGDITVANDGTIQAISGVVATGIRAVGTGNVTIDNSGVVYAGSPLIDAFYYTDATGIEAFGDVVVLNNTGDISAVSYDNAWGAFLYGNTSVSLANGGSITASSPYDFAMGVFAGGDEVSIVNTGTIGAYSAGTAIGLRGYAGSLLEFDNAGLAFAYTDSNDLAAYAIGAQLMSIGDIVGSNSGVISGVSVGDAEAIGLQIMTNGVAEFENSGTITASHATYAVAVDLAGMTIFENTGSIYVDAALDGQVAVRGGAGTQIVINRGDITGALVLGAGADIFAGYAGSEWLVNNATTYMGGGDDMIYNFGGSVIHLQDGAIDMGAGVNNLFENSGTIRVSGTGVINMGNGLLLPLGPDEPEAVPSLNALPFVNDGLITFLDGAPDDILSVVGDFGGDGALAIDVGILAGLADVLYIDGSVVAGTTQTVHAEFDGRVTDLLDPVTFAVVTGNTVGDAFVGGIAIGAQSDFLDFQLEVTSAVVGGDTEYRLGVDITGLNSAGSVAAAVAPGAHSLINSHVGNWRQRMGVLPNTDGLNGLGPWVRVWRDSGHIDVTHTQSFGPGGVYRFEQDNDGREVGFNFDSGYGISWGVMVGSADAVQHLDGSIGRNRIDLDSAGLYATWIGKHLYADVSWRGMDFRAHMRTAGGTMMSTEGDATALSIEAGWRGLTLGAVNVVPQLQYTRANITNIDDVSGISSSFEYDPGASERLRFGLEFSRTFDAGSVIWTPYGSINAIRESGSENAYTVADLHTGLMDTEGTSGMVELGIGAQINGWSITAGASWTDGGAQESFVGGQMILRYTW